ncbi:MAG: glycosyltransferase [Gemmatimonadaceae bacterium]|nr:glycosyltransferase [Gemmatimonadaceae bacterium]
MTAAEPTRDAGSAPNDSAAEVDLSVVIPSYNTRELMEQALRTVDEASGGLRVQVIVVDNASRDGSQEMVEAGFPHVELIRNDRNLGFGGANNIAFGRVKGRHVLLLNSDTIVRADTLRTLVEFMDQHPEAGAAGCRILNPDGSLQLDCRRGFPTPSAAFYKLTGLSRLFPRSRRFGRYNLTYLDPEETSEVDALSGSCMIVRGRVLEEVGGFDEDYFMYGEDLDWCFRMGQAGWKIYYVPATQIIHFGGASGRAESMRIQFRKSSAMSTFVSKHMRDRYRFFPAWMLHAGILAYGLYSFLGPLARSLALPVLDGLLFLLSVRLALLVRYHADLLPLIAALERVCRGLGLDVNPTRWVAPPSYTDFQWLLVYLVPLAIWSACFFALGLYDRRRYSPAVAALAVALGFAAVVTTAFFFKDYSFSRLAAGAAWVCSTVLVAGWRLGARWLTRSTSGRRLGRRRLLMAGTDPAMREFVELVQARGGLDCQIVGFAGSSEERGRVVSGAPVLGVLEELSRLVKEYDVDEVLFSADTVTDGLGHVRGRWRRSPRRRLVPGRLGSLDLVPESVDDLPLVDIHSG